MKKLFYLIMAVVTLLFAAGCQREKGLSDNDGRLADVTFRVALDGMQTKAFSDGLSATCLDVLVYAETNDGLLYLSKVQPVETPVFVDRVAPVTLKLVRGGTYTILFWAHNPDIDQYELDAENGTITIGGGADTGTAVVFIADANDDKRDAFFGKWKGTVGPDGVDANVDLKRPFAQINLLTSDADFKNAENNAVDLETVSSSMTVTAPNVLDLFTGEVSGEAEYTFEKAVIDTAVNIANYQYKYKYLSMNYILAAPLGGTANPSFKVFDNAGSEVVRIAAIPNLPVRQNYRTVLFGDVFCADAIFQVTIQNEFGGNETVPLENAENQVITFNPDSAPGQDSGFEYDEDALTGAYTMTVGETLDFAGAFSSNSTKEPIYTSSNEEVGKFAAVVGDAPTLFTALAAGQTVVNLHFNAVINGEEVKSEIKNFKSADVNITITVVGLSVPAPMFEPGSVEEMNELSPEDPYVYLLIEDPEDEFEDAVIYYKTAENAEWTIYDDLNPIEITEETTIWAYASMDGWEDSEVVWASFKLEEEEEGQYFVKVNEAPNGLADGEYLIVYEDGQLALDSSLETLDVTGNVIQVEIENDMIPATQKALAAVVSIEANVTSQAVTYSIQAANGLYIGHSGSKNKLNTSETPFENTITIEGGDAIITCDGYSLRFNNTSTEQRFRYFSGTNQKIVQLYKLVDGDEPQPAEVYAIEIDGDVQNGTIESDPASEAEEGATVTLTLTPEEGYAYVEQSLQVIAANQSVVDVEVNASPSGDGVFVATFTMPACDVFVTASFEEEAEPGDTYAIEIDDVQNGSIVSDPASEAEEGATVTLTITPEEGYAYVEQSLQVIAANQSVVDVEVNASLAAQGVYEASFTMPACDVFITALFEEGQPQETFTSNVEWTVSGDTKSYDNNVLNVNNVSSVANIKLGTGSAYGSASITLPAGTKSVSFYAVAWSGKSSNVKFTVENDAFGFAIAGNSGATGSGPYTISVTDSDKYSFQFDQALESETEVTVETYNGGGTDKRAFLFAINAVVEEGGDEPVAPIIVIDGDFEDWAGFDELASDNGGTGRIRNPWQFASDDDNLYFHFILRKEKMRTAYKLSLIFDWDESGSYTADNLSGGELCVKIQPFTNETGGTPVCVNGTVTTAEINGSTVENLSISVYGVDPDPNATGDTADYYLEMCIPKSCLPNLPEAGTEIKIGAGYEWYNTGLQTVTL